MQTYYIITKDSEIYELDATTGISIKEIGDATEFPVESGVVVSDHYVNKNVSISLSGSISDAKVSDKNVNLKSTEDYILGLRKLKARKEFFSVVWRRDSSEGSSGISGTDFIEENCLFTTIGLNQSSKRGNAYGNSSYAVSLQISSIRVAEQATISIEKSNLLDSITSDKQLGSGTTSEFGDDSKDANNKFDWGLFKYL